MYTTIAIIITKTSATPAVTPIIVILRFLFSGDGLSVKRGTVLGRTVGDVAIEEGGWTTAVEDEGWTTAVEDGGRTTAVEDREVTLVVDIDVPSVV